MAGVYHGGYAQCQPPRGIAGFAYSTASGPAFRRPSIAFAPLLTPLALTALRAMGAAMSPSLVAEHGR